MTPLIEETHSDLCSSLEGVSQAPLCEVMTIERSRDFKPPKDLFYQMTLKRITDEVQSVGKYEPEVGDLIAFTDIRPRSIEDLNRPKSQYHIAHICRSKDEFTDKIPVLSSKCLEMDIGSNMRSNKTQELYAVYLLNMTTNVCIWRALNSQLEGANMNIIKKVLQPNSTASSVLFKNIM